MISDCPKGHIGHELGLLRPPAAPHQRGAPLLRVLGGPLVDTADLDRTLISIIARKIDDEDQGHRHQGEDWQALEPRAHLEEEVEGAAFRVH
eukprot:CAMPEP_0173399416 /NCGR_PEP_ID=MMETSP1356-20130122/44859_1 /TAXON_ID=77927 ORGANISM="Hemiselmis virescens, Strain PCC157" /NCGR_SAMPLE_ID=MMETSP1356 /ASSEMBLY_ACC=CAM_ASM_000847 /LENGTH=91 /DNA_ID=CAMNT_0014359125 /DNA_START=53 /DNA_END=325 /DNA_ORIENTATION=-